MSRKNKVKAFKIMLAILVIVIIVGAIKYFFCTYKYNNFEIIKRFYSVKKSDSFYLLSQLSSFDWQQFSLHFSKSSFLPT